MRLNAFVGRAEHCRQLGAWIDPKDWRSPRGLRVIGISGPGGVGKTRFLEHAVTPLALATHKYLTLRVSGHEKRADPGLFSWMERLLRSAIKDPTNPDQNTRDRVSRVFKRTPTILDYQREVAARIQEDLGRDNKNEDTVEAAKALWGVCRGTKKLMDLDLDGLDTVRGALRAIENGPAVTLPRRVKDFFRGQFGKFKLDPLSVLAEAFVDDLDGALRPLKGPREYSRLFLVLDDYEYLERVFDGFLIEELLPRLRESTFQTTLALVGRDDLVNTSEAQWTQGALHQDLDDRRILLTPLILEEVRQLCVEEGIPTDYAERIHRDSHGYPWLIESVLEEMTTGGRIPATAYDRFFQRMSRFMTDRQKSWFKSLCFLDQVTLDSIPTVIHDAAPAEVLDWFKREPSIRNTDAEFYTVWPFIRERVLRGQWIEGPKRFAEVAEAAGLRHDPQGGPTFTSSAVHQRPTETSASTAGEAENSNLGPAGTTQSDPASPG